MTKPQAHRRRDMVRHLLHPQQVRESLRLGQQASWRNSTLVGGQAALTVLLALPLIYVSPWPHLIGYGALGALVALFGRFERKGARLPKLIWCALLQIACVVLMSLVVAFEAPMAVQLGLLALSCGGLLVVCARARFGAPGPLIFIFAVGASLGHPTRFDQVVERGLAVAVVAALALIICALSEPLRQLPTEERPLPEEVVPHWRKLALAALRAILGAGLAIWVSLKLGGQHPAWAAMGMMAVVMGPRLNLVMNRAIQRTLGTVVGAALAWLLLVQSPPVMVVIVVLAVLQLLTEVLIGMNYGLGQVMVTPMALLMTWLGAGRSLGAEIAPERIMETCIGALIGLLIAIILSSLEDRRHLARHRAGS